MVAQIVTHVHLSSIDWTGDPTSELESWRKLNFKAFQASYVLVLLDGLSADTTSLFELRYALCSGGELTCVIRRDSQVRRLTINQTSRDMQSVIQK
jgi:hypothetical protein